MGSRPVGVITGGTQGIGRHAAAVLALDGWSVALCSRHSDEAVGAAVAISDEYGVPALGAAVDVRSARDLDRFAGRVIRELGLPMAVLANAGVLGPVGPLHAVDMVAWATAVEIDLIGVANTFAAFAPAMAERRRGSLVAMSGGGVGGPNVATGMSAYTCSKAAVVMLTETVAREMAEYGVRVNAIAPGAIRTRLMEPVLRAGPAQAGEELFRLTVTQREKQDSLDAFGAMLRLLVDPEAPFITGRTLSARWDDPASLRERPPEPDSSLYQLRRIDGTLFGAVPRDV